jgi:hypothetical protein
MVPSITCCLVTEGQAAERIQRQCLQLRSEMSHFVTNLQYYLMFEVMESAWQVSGSAHSAYLSFHVSWGEHF